MESHLSRDALQNIFSEGDSSIKLRSLKQQKQPYLLQRVSINRVTSKRFRARLIGAHPTSPALLHFVLPYRPLPPLTSPTLPYPDLTLPWPYPALALPCPDY